MFALITRSVSVVVVMSFPRARIERTVERLFLVHPELEIAGFLFRVAGESDLRYPWRNLLQYGLIRDIAHLKIIFDHNSLFVTYTTVTFGHQRVACLV